MLLNIDEPPRTGRFTCSYVVTLCFTTTVSGCQGCVLGRPCSLTHTRIWNQANHIRAV